MSMSFEDENLVEKADTLPDVIQFDKIFSNDMAEDQEFDLCFEAEEDDELISMVSQAELFHENGVEKSLTILVEDDNEDAEMEDDEDQTSSDVDADADEPVEGDADIDGEPDAQPAPAVQVNVDADDVNINAAPTSENAIPNLLEDDQTININHVETLNVAPETEEPESSDNGDVTEPAAPPTPTADEPISGPGAVDGGNDMETSEPENLLDDPEETDDAPAEDDGTSNEEEVPEEKEAPEEEKEDESCKESAEELEDKANLVKTDSFEEMPYDGPVDNDPAVEIPGETDTPNLLEESDDECEGCADPTHGDAPDAPGAVLVTPGPERKDTSANSAVEDEPKNGGEEEAMKTVDDLEVSTSESAADGQGILQTPGPEDKDTSVFSALEKDPDFPVADALTDFEGIEEANLLEADEDPQEDATEEDAKGSVDFAVAQDITTGLDGLEKTFNNAPTFDNPDVARCQAEYSNPAEIPNLLEADADTNFDGIEERDNEDKFHDDLKEPMNKDLEKVMNNAPVDSTKKEEGLKDFQDTQKDFEDNTPNNDVASVMNSAPEDSTKKEEGIKDLPDKEDQFEDILRKPLDLDPERVINNSDEDPSKDSKGTVQESDDMSDDSDDDNVNVDEPTDECNESVPNLLETWEADDADTDFEGIEKKDAQPASNYEVTPDQVAVPAEDKDQDGVKSEVGGPKEDGDDEQFNTVAEEAIPNMLEADYEEVVNGISSDSELTNDINDGLELPPEAADPDVDDDVEADEEAADAVG